MAGHPNQIMETLMKVLVTGAGGRIGSHLSRLLLTEGHEVRAFGLRDDPRLLALAADGADIYPGDLETPETLTDAVSGVDAVCHLAAALTTHDVSPDRFIDVNLRGTFNLLDAVRSFAPDVQRMVYTSSDAVYWSTVQDRAPGQVIGEDGPLRPGSIYGATKVGAELLCGSYWETYGVPYTVMRPTATSDPIELITPKSVFGRRWFVKAGIDWYRSRDGLSDDDQHLLAALESVDDGSEKLYSLVAQDGTSSLSTLGDARDAAAGMRAMIEPAEAIAEAFNIGPAQPHADRDLVEHIGKRLGLEVVEIRSPAARPSWNISSAKARDLLGYQPTRDVYEMIDEAVAQPVTTEGIPS